MPHQRVSMKKLLDMCSSYCVVNSEIPTAIKIWLYPSCSSVLRSWIALIMSKVYFESSTLEKNMVALAVSYEFNCLNQSLSDLIKWKHLIIATSDRSQFKTTLTNNIIDKIHLFGFWNFILENGFQWLWLYWMTARWSGITYHNMWSVIMHVSFWLSLVKLLSWFHEISGTCREYREILMRAQAFWLGMYSFWSIVLRK